MTIRTIFFAAVIAIGAAVAAGPATAQDRQSQMGPDMMQGSMDQQKGEGMMRGGMMRGGGDSDMMCPMMRSGMMQSGMMGGATTGSGMGALFGSRVTPVMNLSVDDVRGYLAAQLGRLNNKRLKLGEIKSTDETITAEIVTVDNSLVQRLDVDRHTGAIKYEN